MQSTAPIIDRYNRLCGQISRLEKEWLALYRTAFSPNAADRLLFDPVAFAKLTQQIELLDAELVAIESQLPEPAG